MIGAPEGGPTEVAVHAGLVRGDAFDPSVETETRRVGRFPWAVVPSPQSPVDRATSRVRMMFIDSDPNLPDAGVRVGATRDAA